VTGLDRANISMNSSKLINSKKSSVFQSQAFSNRMQLEKAKENLIQTSYIQEQTFTDPTEPRREIFMSKRSLPRMTYQQ